MKEFGSFLLPNKTETAQGVMDRYFVYKRNEPNSFMVEVDKKQIDNFFTDNVGINQYLYNYLTIPWKLTGPELDVFLNGIVKISGVVSSNQRIIDRFSKKFPILRQILNNPREHTEYDR
jgi:hypothetical protein